MPRSYRITTIDGHTHDVPFHEWPDEAMVVGNLYTPENTEWWDDIVDGLRNRLPGPSAFASVEVRDDPVSPIESPDRTKASDESAIARRVLAVVRAVHAEFGDDVCWMAIDRIFVAAGLPVPDRAVGDKFAMLKNCTRFIDTKCAGGQWESYADVLAERDALRALHAPKPASPQPSRQTDDALWVVVIGDDSVFDPVKRTMQELKAWALTHYAEGLELVPDVYYWRSGLRDTVVTASARNSTQLVDQLARAGCTGLHVYTRHAETANLIETNYPGQFRVLRTDYVPPPDHK